MDAETIIKRLRKHKEAKDAETIGVIGSYGKVAEIGRASCRERV